MFTSTCESGLPSVLSSGVEVPLYNEHLLSLFVINQILTMNNTSNCRPSSLRSLSFPAEVYDFVVYPINATVLTFFYLVFSFL